MQTLTKNSVRRSAVRYASKLAVWSGMRSLTDGTDIAVIAGTRYWSSISVNSRMSLTGLSYLIGSVGNTGTDKVIVELHDGGGALIATSAIAGTTVGAAGTIQKVPFVSPVTLDDVGEYFICVQFNSANPKLRTLAAGTSAEQTVSTGTGVGTFGVSVAIAPPGTFAADVGPIAFTY